jgi:flagella basal body P-ring formation protein FlgA
MDALLRRALARAVTVAALAAAAAWAHAGAAAPAAPPYAEGVRALVAAAAARAGATRVEVDVGAPDPRLRLAPCARVEPFLPRGARPWGRTRVGLRCAGGTARWTVYVPATVKVYAPALVAVAALPAGAVLRPADLRRAEADLAAAPGAVIVDGPRAVGRTLARSLSAGQAVREGDLKPRQWFAAGETVTVVARGAGFTVYGEALALTSGVEGRPARVRTPSGRVLTGRPVAERRVALGRP